MFSGSFFMERQWGPGPVCTALAALAAVPELAPSILTHLQTHRLAMVSNAIGLTGSAPRRF